jgi:hypothetical protein
MRHVLFIVLNGQLKMSGYNTRLLVVASGVTSEFKDFGSQVFENGGEVNGGTGTDALSIVALLQEPVDTTDRELDCTR